MQRETLYDAVFDAQADYRLLLDAMARPGKINKLPRRGLTPPPGLSEAAASVGFALLDANAGFFVDGEDVAITRYLVVNTSARPVGIAEADFVFAGGLASPSLVASMKKGTLAYPDEGATLVVDVEELAAEVRGLGREVEAAERHVTPDSDSTLALTLSGPGVAGERVFFVRGLNTTLVQALQECNAEFPLGVDLVLADGAGRIACIPRSSKVKWAIIN
ncbi:phosphonate C-P lyase system protein PhnH [Puia dinghuensis]|uniref:Phosphonate C-P lyase system protein PhnH n=1 Tax=Puia dinghuensis TaxID=1792502 RepID=A0A8J2UFB4_9BACT|nr:phosphonate C-P lyase system protein PhnH [Puia dinghuensis]GGB07274.1 phosphonate C-P lyase system protein PhnH [Puia dinghuensis]